MLIGVPLSVITGCLNPYYTGIDLHVLSAKKVSVVPAS